MKKVLYGGKGNFYKANLHCHSTYSDGKLTVSQIKEEYMKRGYSIVAFTDHEYIVDEQPLTDDKFLAINSYEVSINTRRPGPGHEDYKFVKTYHLNLYKKTPDDLTHIYWKPSDCWCGDKSLIEKVVNVTEQTDKTYSQDMINELIKSAHEHNFLVAYNHPRWSMQGYEDYYRLEGLDFLEIFNNGCWVSGNDEYVPHIYDDFLRQNKKIYCTCTDDNHNWVPFDHVENDSFGGWVVINAPELKYETVIKALENGDFYASTGAVIDKIVFEDGYITVNCSSAKYVTFTTGTRNARRVVAAEGKPLTEAYFRVYPDDDYVRLEVTDFEGNKANSQAYFTEDLFRGE